MYNASIVTLKKKRALAGVAELVRYCPVHRKVANLIPGQDTCLCWGPKPQSGSMQEATDPCSSLIDVPLSPIFFKINKILLKRRHILLFYVFNILKSNSIKTLSLLKRIQVYQGVNLYKQVLQLKGNILIHKSFNRI